MKNKGATASSDLTHVYPPASALQEFECLEFFAGHAALTRAMRRDGVRAARFDLNYVKKGAHKRKSNWMDLLSSSGFGFLECFVFSLHVDSGVSQSFLSWVNPEP